MPEEKKKDPRGNRNGQPREPKDENGVRHPTEKQLQARKKLHEISKYQYDDNLSQILSAMCKVASLQEIDTNNPKEVERNCLAYIETCAEQNVKPTEEGLALALGVCRSTLQNWLNGKYKKPPEVIDVLKKYMSLLNALHIQYMVEGKINPIPAIFLAKNNFENYRDQQEMKFTTEYQENTSTDELASKYADAMAVDITDDVEDV